jgi:hypothetical protein
MSSAIWKNANICSGILLDKLSRMLGLCTLGKGIPESGIVHSNLNEIGVKRFAQNLKRAYFSASPRSPEERHRKFSKYHHPRRPIWRIGDQAHPPNNSFPPFHQISIPDQFNQRHPYMTPHSKKPYNPYAHNHHNNTPSYPRSSYPDQRMKQTSQQGEGRLPTDMVQLIKLLHNRYVTKY